jgi:hypothetical protein
MKQASQQFRPNKRQLTPHIASGQGTSHEVICQEAEAKDRQTEAGNQGYPQGRSAFAWVHARLHEATASSQKTIGYAAVTATVSPTSGVAAADRASASTSRAARPPIGIAPQSG